MPVTVPSPSEGGGCMEQLQVDSGDYRPGEGGKEPNLPRSPVVACPLGTVPAAHGQDKLVSVLPTSS